MNSVVISRTFLITWHLLIGPEVLLPSTVLIDCCQAISANTAPSKRRVDAEDGAQPAKMLKSETRKLKEKARDRKKRQEKR
jgi:hypothetical protein